MGPAQTQDESTCEQNIATAAMGIPVIVMLNAIHLDFSCQNSEQEKRPDVEKKEPVKQKSPWNGLVS